MALEDRDYAGGAVETTITASIISTDLSISIASATGWPSGGANGPFHVIIDYDVAGREVVEVASRTGTTLTVADVSKRGVTGTTAASHASGAKIRHCFTSQDADEANRAVLNTIGRVTTKGDLIAATGANVFARRAVGSNGLPLVADSGQATGLNYAALTSAGLAADSVGSSQIAADAVGASELANNSVDTGAIVAGAVTDAKMAANTLTAASIAADAIGSSELANSAVDAAAIAAGAIANGAMMATGQQLVYVQAANPGAVGAGKIWINTTAGKRAMLQRNSGDTAWEVLQAYEWRPYTPTYPGMAAVGNAVHFARYIRTSGLVIVNGFFRVGTTTSFVGLTNLAVGLPTNAQAKDLDSFVNYPTVATAEFFGHSGARATQTGAFFGGIGVIPQAGAAKALDRMNFITTAGASGAWEQNTPTGWVAGHRFSYFFEYEPATLEDSEWVT